MPCWPPATCCPNPNQENTMQLVDDSPYNPTAEKLVKILSAKAQIADLHYLRVVVGYYFALAATQMRCVIATPDSGDIPVNLYGLSLAPSGFGKTRSCNFIEGEVLHLFRDRFLGETFPLLAEANLPKLALQRANRKAGDPDEELVRVQKEFERQGDLLFSFDSGTQAAVKQMRHKLLMANAGSMNLIMDEVGANLTANREVFDTFIELFDKGIIKAKLIKNTTDNVRSEEIIGKTPANLLMFGVPNALLNGSITEDSFVAMLDMGYARRCFFAYVKKGDKRAPMTPEEIYALRTNSADNTVIEALAQHLEALADMINANKRLVIAKETYLKLIAYQLDCEARAALLPEHQDIRKNELVNRFFKVLKLAGAYAFIEDVPEVTAAHIGQAIQLAEDSGIAFDTMLARDKPWVKLAKYIADVGQDVTQADLAEDLPFYKGSSGAKQDMLNLAIAYGYKNNIIIKKTFADGIEFLRGETLQATDLARLVVAYSTDITEGYRNEHAPFDQLHKLTQAPGLHWTSHHLNGGYRNEENAIAGFNLVVVDVDGGVNLAIAQALLKPYKFLLYTTKRHTEAEHRFRIVLPMNFTLALDAKDYKEFMANIYEWLPFAVDTATNQRARKWMSHAGQYVINEGELLDVLPFIPKTSKNEERKILLNSQQSMDNLERWMINHIGDGNRNTMLHRYGRILVDAGFGFDAIKDKVFALNDKIADKLDQAELLSTVLVTVSKEMAKR
jgi:hypothetical protein